MIVFSRRYFWFLGFLITFSLQAADQGPRTVIAFQPDRVDAAIEQAIKFLVDQQDLKGSIFDGREKDRLAITALAVMAMASVGHMPSDDTRAGKAMDRALNYIILPGDNSARVLRGYFGERDGSRMYGHGIITLLLTEMLGMGKDKTQDNLIRDRAVRGIKVILEAQRYPKGMAKYVGGWRYTPTSNDADLSVTVWQLMALRSANNAGLAVPTQSIQEAVKYLQRSYYSNRNNRGVPLRQVSGFGYMPGSSPNYPMTAAGLLALQVVGGYNFPETKGAGQWLLNYRLTYDEGYFFYGSYYLSQGMKKLGGEFAANTRQRIETILLDQQLDDGSWLAENANEKNHKKVYATSLAILCLSVKHGFLPIYQD